MVTRTAKARRTTEQRKADLRKKLQEGQKTRTREVTRVVSTVSPEEQAQRQAEIEAFRAEEQRRQQAEAERQQQIQLFDLGFQEAQQQREQQQSQFDISFGEAQQQREQEQSLFDISFGEAQQQRLGEISAFEERLEAGSGPSPEQLFFDERTQPLRTQIDELNELETLQQQFIAENHTRAKPKSPCATPTNPFRKCPRGGLFLPKGVAWSSDPYTGDFVPIGFTPRASGKVRAIYGDAVETNQQRLATFNADRQRELDRLEAIRIQRGEIEQDLSVFGERPESEPFDPALLGPRPGELTLEEFGMQRESLGLPSDRPVDLTLEAFGMRPEDLDQEAFGMRPEALTFDPLGPEPEPLSAQEMLFTDIIPGNIRPFQERREVTREALTERRVTKRKPGRRTFGRRISRRSDAGGFSDPFSVNLDDIGLF